MKTCLLILVVPLVLGTGCAAVKPWERGTLADYTMRADRDPSWRRPLRNRSSFSARSRLRRRRRRLRMQLIIEPRTMKIRILSLMCAVALQGRCRWRVRFIPRRSVNRRLPADYRLGGSARCV